MSQDNEVTGCCSRYSSPEEQCDRYPACDACSHLIADDGPTPKEGSQHAEADFRPAGFTFGSLSEEASDRLY